LESQQLNLNVDILKDLPISNGKKFCTNCALMKPEVGGEIVVTTRSRWRCATCKARASVRKYESKKEKHK
jgi:transposase-like protein